VDKKTYLVTGANSGLGKASASLLARMNHRVIMLRRNQARGEAALSEIREKSGNSDVELALADLASLASIRRFVETFKASHRQLCGLLNCAGVRVLNRQLTQDGLELMFASEYLGHFLLTNLLVETLKAGAPSRVITISGEGHKAGVEGGQASKQVVLAKILFTYELSRRLAGTGVTANTVCPGFTRTNLSSHYPWFIRLVAAVRIALTRPQTPEQGASHIVYLATAPELEGVTGRYFQKQEAQSSPESCDQAIARRLWQVSEELVGQKFEYTRPQA
jgi:NAD(P)-dependent dehydrogenase (short-subunit alcohol dehydrogenase family)